MIKRAKGSTFPGGRKGLARRNVHVAAINSGLVQGVFSLEKRHNDWEDNWEKEDCVRVWRSYAFSVGPNVAGHCRVASGKWEELFFEIVLWPEDDLAAFATEPDLTRAHASARCMLERLEGRYIQSGSSLYCPRARIRELAEVQVEPVGYLDWETRSAKPCMNIPGSNSGSSRAHFQSR